MHGSSEMQQQLASTSNPLSHSCGIGNVCGCTLFLPAPIMPTISWVKRLNQEKGEKRGIKTADLGIYTLSILLCLPKMIFLGIYATFYYLLYLKIYTSSNSSLHSGAAELLAYFMCSNKLQSMACNVKAKAAIY